MKRQRENSSTSGEPKAKIQKTSGQPYKQLRVEDALAYLEQVKLKFKDRPEVYSKFLDIMKEFKHQTIDTPGVISKVSELFKGHNALILGFNTFLPPGYKIEIDEATSEPTLILPGQNSSAQPKQAPAPATPAPAVPKVETSTTSSTPTTTTPPSATPSAPSPADPAKTQQKQSIDFDQAINYVTKIKLRFNEQPDTYKKFLDILHTYQKEQTTIKKVYEQVSTLFKDHADLLEEFSQFLPVPVSQGGKKKQQKPKTGQKRITQDINRRKRTSARRADELIKRQTGTGAPDAENADDMANGEDERAAETRREFAAKQNISKYGPSYRILPRNFPQPICSERSDLCNEVLNDELVSVPAGSEEGRDYYKKSQYDEILYQCEDDRCELDIVIEQNQSTIRFLTPLCEKITLGEKIQFQYESLRDIHRASIARIYGDKGNEILEGLRKNPMVAIPIVLKRLKQKDEEWQTSRKELNKFWREIYEKNYEKAQESQANNFKQLDKKKLHGTNILHDMQLRQEYNKELLVVMRDLSIHSEILYLLLKAEKSAAEADKLKNLWKTFMIPFLGLKSAKLKAEVSELTIDGVDPLLQLVEEYEKIVQLEEQTQTPIVEQSLGKMSTKQHFYGNAAFLLFFRYYQMLYYRLSKAKELAIRASTKKFQVNSETVKKHELFYDNRALNVKPVTSTTTTTTQVPLAADIKPLEENTTSLQQAPNDSLQSKTENKELAIQNYRTFLKLALALFDKSLEQTKYEEECRKVLGWECYFTLTLERLFLNLQYQIHSIVTTDQCARLLDAFVYERRRVNRYLDKSYMIHAQKIIGTNNIYSVKYNPENKKMYINMIVVPELDPERDKAEKTSLQYIDKYLASPALVKKSRLFLARNKKRMPQEQANRNIVLVNGLECKLCIATTKLFFVEDTEDVFFRHKKNAKKKPASSTKRAVKFGQWLQKKAEQQQAQSTTPMDTSS